MKITFHHSRPRLSAKGGTTVAMEEIPVDMFKRITEDHIVEAKLGLAKCSKKDNYNKKIGRNIAKARMIDVELEVLAMAEWIRPDERPVKEVVLGTPDGVILALRHTAGNKTVHLLAFEEK